MNLFDKFGGRHSTPSPAYSSITLPNHLSAISSLPAAAFPSHRNLMSSPFLATPRSISPWQDNLDSIEGDYGVGHVSAGFTCDPCPPRFQVSKTTVESGYTSRYLSCAQLTTSSVPTAQIISNATHDQLRQCRNVTYTQLHDAFTKARAEAETIT